MTQLDEVKRRMAVPDAKRLMMSPFIVLPEEPAPFRVSALTAPAPVPSISIMGVPGKSGWVVPSSATGSLMVGSTAVGEME